MADRAVFSFRSHFPCSVDELYDWHSRPGALERLLPPWERSTVVSRKGGLEPGGEVVMRMHAGPIPFTWVAHHVENHPGKMFRDVQHKGPFSSWSHSHHFHQTANGSCLHDEIEYSLPLHRYLPGALLQHIDSTLQRTFEHRRRVLTADLQLHHTFAWRKMRILVTGASGVLGRALQPLLTTGGHEVWKLVRRRPDRENRELFWDPEKGEIDQLPEFDAVIHLAGEYIGVDRWTADKKHRIVQSRVDGTKLLARTVASQDQPPEVFLCASAVGFYGDTGNSWVSEADSSGSDFISEVCRRWEESAAPAVDAGIRTVYMRIGISLSPQGGALQRLLSAFIPGHLRYFGSGTQYISWISSDDTIAAIYHAMMSENVHGPLNICAPQPVTNAEFMQTLAKVTGKPLLIGLPAGLLRGIYGQMASEILLSGCKASCSKLLDSGFIFRHASLSHALNDLLGKFDADVIEEKEEA